MCSTTEWTIVRPPRLTDKALTGRYRIGIGNTIPRANGITRADVAHLMLAALDDPAMLNQPVSIDC